MPVLPHTINQQAILPAADAQVKTPALPPEALTTCHVLLRVCPCLTCVVSASALESVVIRAGLRNGEPVSGPE